MIRCECQQKTDWDEALPRIMINYNSSVNMSTGSSPSNHLLAVKHDLEVVKSESSQTSFWKSGHPAFKSFEVGDLVVKKVTMLGNLSSNKIKPRFEGPYRVTKVHDNGVAYELARLSDGIRVKTHHSKLRRYVSRPTYLQRENQSDNKLMRVGNYFTDDESDGESDNEPPVDDCTANSDSSVSSGWAQSSGEDGVKSQCEESDDGLQTRNLTFNVFQHKMQYELPETITLGTKLEYYQLMDMVENSLAQQIKNLDQLEGEWEEDVQYLQDKSVESKSIHCQLGDTDDKTRTEPATVEKQNRSLSAVNESSKSLLSLMYEKLELDPNCVDSGRLDKSVILIDDERVESMKVRMNRTKEIREKIEGTMEVFCEARRLSRGVQKEPQEPARTRHRYQTRSKGPVQDYPNVLRRAI